MKDPNLVRGMKERDPEGKEREYEMAEERALGVDCEKADFRIILLWGQDLGDFCEVSSEKMLDPLTASSSVKIDRDAEKEKKRGTQTEKRCFAHSYSVRVYCVECKAKLS